MKKLLFLLGFVLCSMGIDAQNVYDSYNSTCGYIYSDGRVCNSSGTTIGRFYGDRIANSSGSTTGYIRGNGLQFIQQQDRRNTRRRFNLRLAQQLLRQGQRREKGMGGRVLLLPTTVKIVFSKITNHQENEKS